MLRVHIGLRGVICSVLLLMHALACSPPMHLIFLHPFSPFTVACTLNGTRSAFTAAMHIALGDACPLDVLRVDEGGWLCVEVMRCCLLQARLFPAASASCAGCPCSHPGTMAQPCAITADSVLWSVTCLPAAEGRHAFATCMLSYGFMGDVMVESENYRWLGPLRYDVVSPEARAVMWQGVLGWQARE